MKTKLEQDFLTKKEFCALKLLAQGQTYSQIQESLGVNRDCLYVHVHRIRQKTGIADTKDMDECRRFLAQYNPRLAQPTPRQLEVLRLHVAGRTNPQIAQTLGLSAQSVTNALSQGIKRLGITSRGVRRIHEMRTGIAAIDAMSRPYDEMSRPYDAMSEDVFN